jgi:hypothetical protein
VGKVAKDQVQSYASRKNLPMDVTEKWLAANL